jgi:hypothetical protein
MPDHDPNVPPLVAAVQDLDHEISGHLRVPTEDDIRAAGLDGSTVEKLRLLLRRIRVDGDGEGLVPG